ncbi:MAG: Eco57I restriction-modification methylase domain-containing protein [Planctomycetota bacterium]
MAKKGAAKSGYQDPHEDLFQRIENQKRRRLFLPKLLDEHAADMRLDTVQRSAAQAVFQRWWGFAQQGGLNRNETTIDDVFLSEVFGQALGYRGVTESEGAYERERQFYVPGVGPCDGALGDFPPTDPSRVKAVIELKSAQTHLDLNKSNGRTAVQQVWDYLNAMPPSCEWAILSNFTTIRLYHRQRSTQAYEQYRLKDLATDQGAFSRFYAIFEPFGLIRKAIGRPPLAARLLQQSLQQQREVGRELYTHYSKNRLSLVEHLHREKGLDLEQAIRIAQKLIDRVLFIAFCEDRGLIPANVIERACRETPAFSRTPNPVWQNFLGLFEAMDRGSESLGVENGYNGGLFREEPDCDINRLDLEDVPWTNFFRSLSAYDYRHTVDVDVLGHIFEQSVTELEHIREGGLLTRDYSIPDVFTMPKSPQRKLFGIYYTPVEFTSAIVEYTIDEVVRERFASVQAGHGLSDADLLGDGQTVAYRAYWADCFDALRNLKVCDPACGSGAFLIKAYDALFHHYSLVITELEQLGGTATTDLFDAVPEMILSYNLYGVDLQPEAVEIAQLSLWLRTARKGRTLADLSANIVCGNSLTDDPEIHPHALNWRETFPEVFDEGSGGFDCVIGNPPWERLKLQEREFFALSAPEIASAVSAADRRKRIAALETENPQLYARYQGAIGQANRMLAYTRDSGRYPLTGKGDINTYMLFAELARAIVAPTGRVGLLVPSGIATDKTTSAFFSALTEARVLKRLYDFENRKGLFPDVHRSFKFSILNFGGPKAQSDATDFVFFAHDLKELGDPQRHVPLSAADMKRMNPNTGTCPIFRSRRDAEITRAIYERVPVLIDRNRNEGGNPWGIRFVTMFHQTNDAERFQTEKEMKTRRYKLEGNRWVRGRKAYLPLYEAKMVQAYDHRAASIEVKAGNWVRQGQTVAPTLVERQNPEHVAMPRWWVDGDTVRDVLGGPSPHALLVYKDVTSSTNQRTMIAAFIPFAGVVNSAPIVLTEGISPLRRCCLLANLNSLAYDFIARQKVGGIHLNFFIVEQLPTLAPDVYDNPCPWDQDQTLEQWISQRVLKLSCTANDMIPLGEACGLEPHVHKWWAKERAKLLAELDAAFFILYGVERDDLIYVLSTFQGMRAKRDSDLLITEQGETLSSDGQLILESYARFVAG